MNASEGVLQTLAAVSAPVDSRMELLVELGFAPTFELLNSLHDDANTATEERRSFIFQHNPNVASMAPTQRTVTPPLLCNQ